MATQTHSPFETLARVIEHLDDGNRSVRRTEAGGSDEEEPLRATVVVSVGDGEDGGLDPVDATIDDGLSVTVRAPSFPDPAEALPPGYPPVSAAPTAVRRDGEAVVVTLEVAIGADASPVEAVDTEGSDDLATTTATFGNRSAAAGNRSADAGSAGARSAASGRGGSAASEVDEADERETDGSGEQPDGADGGDPDAEAPSPLAAVRDESVPPYDDVPYLRRLYETSETFAEMSERIEMDVSAETVRRYMIEADVHAPTTYETGGTAGTDETAKTDGTTEADETAETETVGTDETTDAVGETVDDDPETMASLPGEQLVADGIGLPEELTVRDVVDAVVDARTVHEVQRELGLGYDRTRQLLSQFNVLDLVVGRVADGSDRNVTVDVVTDRIRQSAPDAA